MSGQIMDATLVAAPRQRNTEDEMARIKAGETAKQIWKDKPFKHGKRMSMRVGR
ncbi:hypothetical protein LCGC14_0308670 [marine sediment metagenome]|uniref:Uncharacterized protein n=1 Tax=marine sediment metagenome TaxID=412755 RepID=A0A0F9TMS4_9ZZZZ